MQSPVLVEVKSGEIINLKYIQKSPLRSRPGLWERQKEREIVDIILFRIVIVLKNVKDIGYTFVEIVTKNFLPRPEEKNLPTTMQGTTAKNRRKVTWPLLLTLPQESLSYPY